MPQSTDSRRRTRVGSDSLSASPFAFKRPKIDPSQSGSTAATPHTMSVKNRAAEAAMMMGSLAAGGGVVQMAAAVPPLQVPFRGTRKLVIKNLRPPEERKAKLEEHHENSMREITAATDAVLAGSQPAIPYERMYCIVEDLCRYGFQQKVDRMLSESFKTHVHGRIEPGLMSLGDDDVALLRGVYKEYADWISHTTLIRSTFSFLEQTYLFPNQSRRIFDIATKVFCDMLFPSLKTKSDNSGATSLGSRVVSGMCHMVDLDRTDSERFDVSLLRNSIDMLHVLHAYHHFEASLLPRSDSYFQQFGSEANALSLKDYIQACRQLMVREDERCLRYNFDSTTRRFITNSAQQLLIKDYSLKLLDEGSVARLLAEHEVEAMKVLCQMLRVAKIQDKLKSPWQDYIVKTGTQILKTSKGDEMVLRLIQLKRRLELMARDAFRGHPEFASAIRSQYGFILRQQPKGRLNVGEMVAKYMDMLLRGGLKSLPAELLSDLEDRRIAERQGKSSTGDEDAELDRQLDYALDLFRLLDGKDVFEGFYKKDLARRLLMGRSVSLEVERSMLAKLQEACGPDFTKNLERMFKDLDLQESYMNGFVQYCQAKGHPKSPIDFDVKVLSIASWPTYPMAQVNLPHELAKQIELYEAYFKHKHENRGLKWPVNLSTCVVKAYFPKGAKDLCVSAQQAVVLLAFNQMSDPKKEFLSYGQLQQVTNLEDAELQRTLQSLACAKVRVLSKHPKGREVSNTDSFTVNQAFSHPSTRIKINQVQLRETVQENKETHERIELDRRFETQAVIVRIMKSRKTATHTELVTEAINMLKRRGTVEAADVKKEIEGLIDKDYIERSGSSYTYFA